METSSVKVFEIRNSAYSLGDELIFNVPPNIALLDSQNTYLKFNIRLGGKDEPRQNLLAAATASQYYKMVMNSTIGAASLIKSLTIMDASNSVTIEQITEYNRLARLVAGYTDNESVKNIKELYEGRGDLILGPGGNCQLQDITAKDPEEVNSLYNKKLEVCLPLRLSGILSGDDVFPNFIVGGTVIKIQLENEPWKVLMGQSQAIGATTYPASKAVQNVAAGYSQDFAYTDASVARSGAQTVFELNIGDYLDRQGAGAGNVGENEKTPFSCGQTILIKPTTALPDGATGVISQIDNNAGKVRLTLVAPGADLGAGNAVNYPAISIVAHASKPQMTLSEVELICGVAQPEQKQLDDYEKAVNSGGGYSLQFETWQNYPVNNSAGATQVSNLINCKLKRCKSILSTFENVQDALYLDTDNLTCQVNDNFNPKSYYYTINNLKTPSRDVELTNYIKNYAQSGVVNQIHLKELEDSFNEADLKMKDLTQVDSNFCIGRGLSRFAHYFDFSQSVGECRLNVAFTAQTKALLNHNFVKHIRELVITPTDKSIVM